ncbi:MAG: hypothetical protein ACYCRH_08355 [Acidiferrobacteraceae bacterium]
MEGKRETYFRARLVTAKGAFDLYVYEDEAGTMVVDPQRWFICEVPDYDTPDALIAAFITKLRGLIC